MMGGGPTGRGGDGCWAAGGVKSAAAKATSEPREEVAYTMLDVHSSNRKAHHWGHLEGYTHIVVCFVGQEQRQTLYSYVVVRI
jgi:hypothetical protein